MASKDCKTSDRNNYNFRDGLLQWIDEENNLEL